MFLYISRLNKNIEFSEFDNPIQFAIYSDEDVTKTPHFGLNYIETTDSLKREELSFGSLLGVTIISSIIISLSFNYTQEGLNGILGFTNTLNEAITD